MTLEEISIIGFEKMYILAETIIDFNVREISK